MNLKELFYKKKKLIITSISALIVGTTLGTITAPSKASYEETLSKNKEIATKIEVVNNTLLSQQNQVDDLNKKKNALIEEKTQIQEAEKLAKAEAERKAKEEADRLAKEEQDRKAKEEADRLAKEEQDRKAKEQVAIAQAEAKKQTTNSSPKTSSSNKGNSSTNNVAVEQPKSKMVYKTKSGKKYHSHNSCGKTDPSGTTQITVESAQSQGLGPCSKCF